jgi:hypothetical protein
MIGWLLLGLAAGFILGRVTAPKRVRYVAETESATVARLREMLERDIKQAEERLLSPRCGWSEGDDLRDDISRNRWILAQLPGDFPEVEE